MVSTEPLPSPVCSLKLVKSPIENEVTSEASIKYCLNNLGVRRLKGKERMFGE